jgi:isopenicillin N synthase-like dioxygenase
VTIAKIAAFDSSCRSCRRLRSFGHTTKLRQEQHMNQLPLIDIAPLYSDDAHAWQSVAKQIDSACRDWGFFYIKGHPISAARIDSVLDHAHRFFALPAAEKLKIDITRTQHHRGYGAIATEQLDPSKPSDLKETFDMGLHLPADHPEVLAEKPLRGPNRHPSISGWEALMEQHYVDMQALAQTLLRAMTLALGIERDFFDSRFNQPVSVLRMIHYPPRHTASSAEQQGAGAHTDYGCITLLYQDAAAGLQVRNVKGEWIDAPPIEGTFVVNLGDMMARWSNDRYLSTPHRVISPLGMDRYSMPFFAEPHPDTVIECLPGCHDELHPAKYAATTCANFLLSRFADTYAYRREQEAG